MEGAGVTARTSPDVHASHAALQVDESARFSPPQSPRPPGDDSSQPRSQTSPAARMRRGKGIRRTGMRKGRQRGFNSTIAPRSKKQIERVKPWAARKRELFRRDRHCRYPECTEPASNCDPHHLLTRGGDQLSNLVALCRGVTTPNHHDWVHLHRRKAERLGLLLSWRGRAA